MTYLSVSVLIFIATSIYFGYKRKYSRFSLIVSVVSAFGVICLPNYTWVVSDIPVILFFNFLKNSLLILLHIASLFVLNLNYEELVSYYKGGFGETFVMFWVAFLYFFAYALTLSFVIQFLGDRVTILKIKYGRKKENHIFFGTYSSYEKKLCEVEALGRKHRIILINKEMDNLPRLSSRILSVTLNNELTLLNLAKSGYQTSYYLLDGDIEGAEMAIDLVNYYKNKETDDIIYINDSHKIVESYLHNLNFKRQDSSLRIRLINEERTAIYNYFYSKKHILQSTFTENPHFVIVGEKKLTIEGIKLLSWLTQIYDQKVMITCIHSSEELPATIRHEMPAMFETLAYENEVGISFLKVSKLTKALVYEKIEQLSNVSGIFLFVDELENIGLARTIRQRWHNNSNRCPLVIAVETPFLTKQCHQEFSDSILQLGQLSDQFDTALEKKARILHEKYHGNVIEKNFYNNQYNYYSSLARALGRHYFPDRRSEDVKRSEHNRWSIYLKTEGWTYSKNRKDDCKKHDNLVPYEELMVAEKVKDVKFDDCML